LPWSGAERTIKRNYGVREGEVYCGICGKKAGPKKMAPRPQFWERRCGGEDAKKNKQRVQPIVAALSDGRETAY